MPCNCIISKLFPSPIATKASADWPSNVIKKDSSKKFLFASCTSSGVGSSNLNNVFVALLRPVGIGSSVAPE